ncbi:MAG: hypothetical protein LBG80_16530 [Bacteroidales bacterium]|jgi:hypothetical protein|nr:hypothetical protein [Bacteroidales bacterium]
MKKRLPIGTQSFEILRTTNCLYIDKTSVYSILEFGRGRTSSELSLQVLPAK